MNIESCPFIRLADGASTDLAEVVDWSRQNVAIYKTYKMPRFEIVTGSDSRVDLAAKGAELVGSVS